MGSAQVGEFEEIMEGIQVAHPDTGQVLDYEEYLRIPEEKRSGDEKTFVDRIFTPRLLRWLGYEDSDYSYNDTNVRRDSRRPDYTVKPEGDNKVAFIVEDKNTTESFGRKDVEQLERYTSGTRGYAIWTNARSVLFLRFYPEESFEKISELTVYRNGDIDITGHDPGVGLLNTLLGRERFLSMPKILEDLSMDEEEWEEQARPIASKDAHEVFMDEMRGVLDKLTLAAKVRVNQALEEFREAKADLEETKEQIAEKVDQLMEKVDTLPESECVDIRDSIESEVSDPINSSDDTLRNIKPSQIEGTSHKSREWDIEIEELIALISEYRENEVQRTKSRKIHNSFNIWKNRFKIIESDNDRDQESRIQSYSEQVAYTFFIRVLLGRILEDKGAIRRIVSDGGISRWREVVKPRDGVSEEVSLQGDSLLRILFQDISKFYQHFFDQPIFDWFRPDDYLVAKVLERLSGFSFENIDRDILGTTYERYVERSFRNKKGHFLTKENVVSYILDEVGYEDRENVVGSLLLDPASGSGSFLVQASRRLRNMLKEGLEGITESDEELRRKLAVKFVEEVQDNYYGFEVNPFSCYLSELNLLLQVLDDILYLHGEEDIDSTISGFNIFNTNSLILDQSVLRREPNLGDPGFGLARDEAKEVKINKPNSFDFVVTNPPYVNKGKQEGALDLTEIPFYNTLFGEGDTNYYHAFIRLANYFVNESGKVGLICPLQLFADKSTGNIRRWLSSPVSGPAPNGLPGNWNLQSLTRFYDRTILFKGVTQAVCVAVWEAASRPSCPVTLKVSGGKKVSHVRNRNLSVSTNRIVASDPLTNAQQKPDGKPSRYIGEWTNEWTVISHNDFLAAWEELRNGSSSDLLYWQQGDEGNLLDFSQGDVNQTRTKPLRPESQGGQVKGNLQAPVPLCKGKSVKPYGPYHANRQLDTAADVSNMDLSESKERDATREQGYARRIYDLNDEEIVCVIKGISGIESARPVKGAIYRRGGDEKPVCFDHSLISIRPNNQEGNEVTRCTYGLLTSSVSNFLVGITSTNQNVSRYEVMKVLVPDMEDYDVPAIARRADIVQDRGERYWNLKNDYGCDSDIIDVNPNPWDVLRGSSIGCETLENAQIKGHLSFSGPSNYLIDTQLEKNQIKFTVGGRSYNRAMGLLLKSVDKKVDSAKKLRIPNPSSASNFLSEYESVRDELRNRRDNLCRALANLDHYVLKLFDIRSKELKKLIGGGMPWATEHVQFANLITSHL